MEKVDNVIRIPTKLEGNFFKFWLQFLEPFHNLTPRESDIFAAFLQERYELSKVISDPDILDTVVMSEDTKRKIREKCGVSLPHFQVIMAKLKKNKVLLDNKIHPKFIPNLKKDAKSFQLLLLFDLQ